jgi:hypothetical protein
MAHKSAIVGSVVERKPTSSFSTPKVDVTGKTGFPAVQHRSKSAFARNRDDLRRSVSRRKDVPTILPTKVHPATTEPADWRQQISKENEERVADMTEEQREEEIQQILERFGTSVGDVLKRSRLARETKSVTGKIDTGGEQHSQGHSTPDLVNFLGFNLRNFQIVFQLHQNLEIQTREVSHFKLRLRPPCLLYLFNQSTISPSFCSFFCKYFSSVKSGRLYIAVC